MDEIVWAVNPRQDSLDGLVTYSCQFAQEYLTMAGIQCRLDVPDRLPVVTLTADIRHNLFLAVKEALNNVVKHARGAGSMAPPRSTHHGSVDLGDRG